METTAELAVEIRQKNPCASLDQIAIAVSEKSGKPRVSRERIRQVLDKAGAPTKGTFPYTCLYCDKTFQVTRYARLRGVGLECCSDECRKAFSTATLVCDECGETITRPVWLLQRRIKKTGQRWVFCNRHCQGVYLGKHYGFGAYPDHSWVNIRRNV